MSRRRHDEAVPIMTRDSNSHGVDGAFDRMLRVGQKQKKCVPAIFIHAGAGFHSHQNEHVHLEACVAAAEMGMRFLRAGGTATEAVEAALRILEDKEITNAGYGSNLSIEGTVECDATIVDHLGRSGACGAVPNIKNPISLAKLILDTSNRLLSLRRVPPNALVGDGAKDFAEEHGIVTVPNEYLVSKNSRDRFLRWQEDLKRAEWRAKDPRVSPTSPTTGQANMQCVPCQYDRASPISSHRSFPRDHTAALMTGTWNEGQPDSPYAGTPIPESPGGQDASVFSEPQRSQSSSALSVGQSPIHGPPLQLLPVNPNALLSCSNSGSPSRSKKYDGNPDTYARRAVKSADAATAAVTNAPEVHEAHRDGSASPHIRNEVKSPRGLKRPISATNGSQDAESQAAKRSPHSAADKEDFITDTIGAIAIDERGHIAAGSSSGGIGMKHRGRLGPAAVVGIGTAVVPCAEDDEEGISVATVTSGTGEHMATTMASQRCAERIYHGTRRGPQGIDIHDDDEDAIMESFIADDFMDHPGVKNCHSTGAVGVMVVKKSRTGYYLYFAHNTDSFALASMGALEKEPRCTMSRLPDGAKVAKGGRKIRLE